MERWNGIGYGHVLGVSRKSADKLIFSQIRELKRAVGMIPTALFI
jgi:hypothetical protein